MGQIASLRPGMREQERMGRRSILDDDITRLPNGANLLAKRVLFGEKQRETLRF
jgi:hypothetical protein